MTTLRAIGYWRELPMVELGRESWHADPLIILEALGPRAPEPELLSYLRGGHVFEVWRGYSWCLIRCGLSDPDLGYRDFTDGLWVWPEGLVHYVEAHELALPAEFLATATTHQGRVPPLLAEVSAMTYDDKMAAVESVFWD